MTIIEAVTETLDNMSKAGIATGPYELRTGEVKEFGHLTVLSCRSLRGRKGKVYTVFNTDQGDVYFWPLASMGPRLGRGKA